MTELLRRYLKLMQSHDFSYHYSDDFEFWQKENKKRCEILVLKKVLLPDPKGRKFVAKAEEHYGYV